eukprot:3670042-Alexandrium_andersonii.AAC.1
MVGGTPNTPRRSGPSLGLSAGEPGGASPTPVGPHAGHSGALHGGPEGGLRTSRYPGRRRGTL